MSTFKLHLHFLFDSGFLQINKTKKKFKIKILNKIVLGITCGNLKEMFNPVDFYNNFG